MIDWVFYTADFFIGSVASLLCLLGLFASSAVYSASLADDVYLATKITTFRKSRHIITLFSRR